MKIYIAGPMRGRPDFNFPAFDEAKRLLTADGHDVVSPADIDRDHGLTPANLGDPNREFSRKEVLPFVQRDVQALIGCDAIYLLEGWEQSKGARAEKALAEWMGLEIRYQLLANNKPFTEVRVVDPMTGAAKGQKLERYDLIPVGPLADVARLYGRGAQKYAERNWERGYAWSLSYAACQRHLNAFWGGESIDPEMNLPHLSAAVFHCLAMLEFCSTHPEKDDRPRLRAKAVA